MVNSFENYLPRRIRYGRGVSTGLADVLHSLGVHKPCIVSDPGVVAAGLVIGLTASLKETGMPYALFDRTEPEPPFSCVEEAAKTARSAGGVDGVVAFGGGSVMDTAKLVAATLLDGRNARSLVGIGKVRSRSLPLVCVPTTAGTGSEATPVAIFTDTATGSKAGVVDPCLVPDVALLDPTLTDSLPQMPTVAAGIDALVHAIEAFIARCATPLARALALEAARHLGPALPAVCSNLKDHTARDALLLGANLAGLAFANSSCCGVHALALPLGGRFHIAHGILTGGLVGEVMRHNLAASADDFGTLAAALGWKIDTPIEFPDRLEDLARVTGIRDALRSAAIPRRAFSDLARKAIRIRRLMDPNPRDISEKDAVRIYGAVL
jgi:alcohol dehydrogenase class IV